MDPASIATILGLAKSGIDTLGSATDLLKKIKQEDRSDREHRAQIVELLEQLLDAKEAQIEVRQKLLELQEEIKASEDFSQIRSNYLPRQTEQKGWVLSLRGNLTDSGLYSDICPTCADIRHQIVPLQPDGLDLKCPECGAEIGDKPMSMGSLSGQY
ncbi:hypothetical protein RHVG_00031 [Rhodovulum phage RS1]|uniref:hypothetical protein n=1 Tax=Rhodobacter phage RC1 TaxID=754055 RepID=UPI0002C18973|nr:hypothetical protein RHWG_00025 [Rhodobacter phage RC1]YP_007676410.1 hypothetical protein RHVG_00031 [Rhodovulum phage RS1]AGH57996.1 hypothetical protein RHVG_00031 [Rhodovulum phage RS1]AGH58046.1 hypothetical protein RHWG_00025 [Rhodobacter phage RC1]